MEFVPIRVLLVDDDEDYYVLTRGLLADVADEHYHLDWIATYQAGLQAILRGGYAVCLVDYHIGERTGLDLLRAAVAQKCLAPIIMLTGQGDHEVDLEAMRAGAADYLTKGKVDSALLERAIRYALERAHTLAALRQSELHTAELYETEQRHNRELEQAYADLRRAETRRDDLTSMIVHDLRNPLTVITTSLELLSNLMRNPNHVQSDSTTRFLQRARSASQRMLSMIDDLLNVRKFEAGELQLALAPLSLSELVIEKQEAVRAQAQQEGKSLTVDAPADVPAVQADASLIGRVVDNLLSNAFKYTEKDGHITLRLESDGQVVTLRVSDDGEGIPPQHHRRIFEKFAQVVDPATGLALRKGSGLGLALCRMAVEAHGGRIWVESNPGQGSTFSFTLPVNPPRS
ncbi:MAG TPA: ATP-binding protein [Candidatus Acidoferrales bacterium]